MSERVLYQGKGLSLVDAAKGRVAIPNALRGALASNSPREDGKDGGSVLIAPHPEYRCLIAYDPAFVPLMKARQEALNEQAMERGAAFNYNFLDRAGAAEPLPFDGSGRMILPTFEMRYARITSAAAFVGSFDWMLIWDPATMIANDAVDAFLKEWVAFECEAKGIAL